MEKIIYKTKASRQSEEKNKIFELAMSLMKQIGYDNLTIRKICEEANISIGSFYRHFESKEELLSYYYVKAQAAFNKKIKTKIKNEDVKKQLVSFYTWYTKYTSDFGVDFCANFFNSKNKTMNTDLVYNQVIEITTSLLDEAIKNGFEIPNGKTSTNISTDLCVIVKGAIFDWCAHEGNYSLPDYVNDLLTRCVSGLL